eukprot:TRINITY_DN18236_c0_g1_i1.p1 TRINITY_DN18236_c0_g1~~TRINITY_DN18236_c0_g1_i1.p1  ORF type:complete len:520 (+),score=175.72 TRINITY_DN18236_c0_g1_i1:65-1624(+)
MLLQRCAAASAAPVRAARWAHTPSWEREIWHAAELRDGDGPELERLRAMGAPTFEKAKRELSRGVARGDSGALFLLMERLDKQFSTFDRQMEEDDQQMDVYWSTFGNYLAKNPKLMVTLIGALRFKDDMSAIAFTTAFYVRALQWVPEQIEELLREHGLLDVCFQLTDYCYKSRADRAPIAFIRCMNLLAQVMRAAEGVDYERRSDVYKAYPILTWWRSATIELSDAMDAEPYAACVFNRLLLSACQNDESTVAQVTLKDLKAMEKTAIIAPGDDGGTAARLKEREFVVVFSGIVVLKAAWDEGLGHAFLQELVRDRWVEKLARYCRHAKWTDRAGLLWHGDILMHAMRAAGTFGNRFAKEVAAADLPTIAIDKIRYTLGYYQQILKNAKPAEIRKRIEDARPLFTGCLDFLGQFARGELMEQQYSSAAYNDERVQCLRHGKVPSMMSRLLRMYPHDDYMVRDCITLTMLLLNYKEQFYDVRDCELLQSFMVVREKNRDPVLQTQVLRVLDLIRERLPV